MINVDTMLQLNEILQGQLSGDGSGAIAGVSIDTRTLNPGEVYFALIGERLDGHDYIEQAIAAGAAGVVVAESYPAANDGAVPMITVKDTLQALTTLGKTMRHRFTQPVVAITGSCGKTTVKEMCGSIFRQAGATLCPTRSFNNHIGLPLTLCQLSAEHKYAILEIGTNHPGEIAALVAIAQPTVAVVNNVGPAHLEGFGTVAAVAQEKGDIYTGLGADGVAVINRDDAFADEFIQRCQAHVILTYSLRQSADVMARSIHFNQQACAEFTLISQVHDCHVTLPLPGEHQVANALAAVSCALACGLSLAMIATGLMAIESVPGRWQSQTGVNGVTLIDDTYNANPKSVTAALECLVKHPGKHWFVLGDMAELGEGASQLHAEIGALAKTLGVDRLFTVGNLSAAASQAFGEQAQHFNDKQDLITVLKKTVDKEVLLVVKGSRSAKMESIIEALI